MASRVWGLPRWMWRTGILGVGVIAVLATVTFSRYQLSPAPAQPVPFSHRVHVGTKGLSCMFCHTSATRSSNAGMPPVEKCLLCHNVIAVNFWPIRKVHQYYHSGKPVPWVFVNRVPQFVRFSHQPHLAKGIDCGQCHGNVAAMDRVGMAHKFDMNFCVTCHWRNKANDNCNICHY